MSIIISYTWNFGNSTVSILGFGRGLMFSKFVNSISLSFVFGYVGVDKINYIRMNRSFEYSR